MESNIQTDRDCCKMKSLNGSCPKPLESINSYLTKKWAISIIITIGNFNKVRFNELLERLEKAKPKILTTRLKELEKENIVKRINYKETPKKVEYRLTKKGQELLKALNPLINWANN